MDSTMRTTANDLGSAAHEIKGAPRGASKKGSSASDTEVRNLIADVEDLVGRVSDAADPQIARLRAKIEDAVSATKKAIAHRSDTMQREAKKVFDAGDDYVRKQPWTAIGIAAFTGLAIGFWISRAARPEEDDE
jgi:ElaB/YqjD/DUF883 family membrane-anchored ribosome-binding protein